ncbi:Inositol-pentakisphosphate 2-kinase [Conoideocrella luteorostrata]|uniref:Inositol-pentakisphosphate 2-kinase n=1 Tax=Conoideocrella luteorostrata TaxID=1105319 RepID=A0AAJ0FWA9_9HYPO|nr:Inositol-pentakisphosphate 2-kinase [Conoideocrella luteorostrata]
MMALHPVPPQHSDEDSASNQGDSPEPYSDDNASDFTQASTLNLPSSAAAEVVDGHDAPPCQDDITWLISPDDMAILNVLSKEPCLTNRQGQYCHCMKRLPAGTKPVKLIGEGAANAVFEIKVPHIRDRGSGDFKGLLLRVAKVPSLGATPTYNYIFQHQFLQTAIRPILGDHVVRQDLVMLHKSGIVKELNHLLHAMNSSRKDKFKDTYVGDTDWGFLVEDMRPQDVETCVLVEFKPKWLSQSPSAPRDAVRCRQCAMELRNLATDLSRNRAHPKKKPCPLALMSPNYQLQACSPFRMAPHLADEANREFYEEALRRIANHAAIHDLKQQQDIHDKLGPLRAEPSDPLFALAMTLRDCTCFAQIDKHSQSIRIQFGDFDWKDPQVKFARWQGVEKELVESGFYTSEWIMCDNVFYRPPTLCLLEQSAAAATKKPEVIQITNSEPGNVGQDTTDHSPLHIPNEVKIYTYPADVGTLKCILEPYIVPKPDFTKIIERFSQ